MKPISRELLNSYLDDALGEAETAQVEQALRQDAALQRQLRSLMQERDRGDHSIGAIWRRQRLSCPTREQLGSYLLQALDGDWQEYIDFHLKTVGCPCCEANLDDLREKQAEQAAQTRRRRRCCTCGAASCCRACKSARFAWQNGQPTVRRWKSM